MKLVSEYTLYNMSFAEPVVIARIWWNGRRIDSNNLAMLRKLQNSRINGLTAQDGEEFFSVIPMLFTNGYISVKRTR